MTPTITPEVARLAEEAKRLGYELDGVIIDTEQAGGFDAVCLRTVKRVRQALAVLAKQDAAPTSASTVPAEAQQATPERVFSTSDDDGFSDDFCSMVDSLLTQHEKLTPGLVYYVADKREFSPSDFMRGIGSTILEYASDQAWQEVDEWSEDFANGVKPEAMAELQVVINTWADKHLRVTFWGVKNIREAAITEQDVADFAYLWDDVSRNPGACSVTDGEAKK